MFQIVLDVSARRDIVILVVADHRLLRLAETEPAFHGLQKLTHRGTFGGDLNLDPLVVFEIDDGKRMAGFVEDVLGDIYSTLVAFGAERLTRSVDLVRVGALVTVGCVSGEGAHHIELVVVRESRIGGGDGSETHLADTARHGRRLLWCQLRRLWWCWDVVVGRLAVYGRHFGWGRGGIL